MADNYRKNETIRMENSLKVKKLKAMTKFFANFEIPEVI